MAILRKLKLYQLLRLDNSIALVLNFLILIIVPDFNNWLDKNNRKPKIASGKINTARMKFGGLNENGLNDVHGINLKKSQEINDYLSYDSTYLNKDSFKSLSQL